MAALLNRARSVLASLVLAAAVAACGHPQVNSFVPAPDGDRIAVSSVANAASPERLIYDFPSWRRGGLPVAALAAGKDGRMYGATLYGGTGSCNDLYPGCGEIFELTPQAGGFAEQTVYNFQNHGDGSRPLSVIRSSSGDLFGLTASYVSPPELFRLQPHGQTFTETTLYQFTGNQNPWGTLTLGRDGSLYGTDLSFGSATWGMIFRFTPSGDAYAEQILYDFTQPLLGVDPSSPLVVEAKSGIIYGTTSQGGTGNAGECLGLGCGTIFMLTPTSANEYTHTILYNFKGTNDGAFPHGLAEDRNGTLYGVGGLSGGSACVDGGCGTVFSFDPVMRRFNLLHSFSRSGLWWPDAQLVIDRNGALYGTTAQNGVDLNTSNGGVFKLTPGPNGFVYTTLHTFAGSPSDGQFPRGGLLLDPSGQAVYGTTYWGGHGIGTVFKVKT